jgi:hypothetical protein
MYPLSKDALRRSVRRRIRAGRRRALDPILRYQTALLQVGQVQLTLRYKELAATGGPLPSYRDVGFRVFCDADEDGIILFLLSVVGSGCKQLVDLGSASVTASNSSNLILHHGWSGLLVDANAEGVRTAREQFNDLGVIPPNIVSSWLTAEGVNDLIVENLPLPGEVDLLSIDIDGNDYWVWRAINAITPRVVVIEYQDILGPTRSVTIPYDPKFSLDQYEVNAKLNNYVGASLRAMVKLGEAKGYRLVATNSYGFNAFFVRNDLATDQLPQISVEDGFPHPWNDYGMRERWPLVADMPWQQV